MVAVPALDYDEACAALRRALVFGINPSLDGITELCEALGRPQDGLTVVQVAGTNGKTSTARFTHAFISAHGARTGLYTSPELQRVNERFEIDAGPVSDAEFARAISAVAHAAEVLRPGRQGTMSGFTEFELTTAAALWLFEDQSLGSAVLEVGMGGRWDATSVAAPTVAVVTGIGLDHVAILGDTVEKIAEEKAAIIKPGAVAVLGPGTAGLEEIFLARAEETSARVCAVRGSDSPSPVAAEATVRFEVLSRAAEPRGSTLMDVVGMYGEYRGIAVRAPAYQSANVATAVAATEALLGSQLDRGSIQSALDHVRIPGRFEVVGSAPPVVIDGSHNPQAAAVLAQAIRDAWPSPGPLPCVVLGVFADKDAENIVRVLSGHASAFIVTAPDSPRALAADDLAAVVERVTGVRPACIEPLTEAVRYAMEHCGDGIVVTGSLATAGQARSTLLDTSATA